MIKINGNYTIDNNGVIYNDSKPLPILKDKDGYSYVNIYIENKRFQRYLAKLVATYLVDNPNEYKCLYFIDGNKDNCHPSNLMWISNKQDAVKRKVSLSWQGKKRQYTKRYAIENSTCPIVKKYYLTNDISIINNYVKDIYESVSQRVRVAMGWCYLYILERLKRYSILSDIKGYFLKMYKYFEKSEFKLKIQQ